MPASRATALVFALAFVMPPLAAQTPPYDRAKEQLREALKKQAMADRVAGIRELVDVKDVRGTDDFLAAIRVVEKDIEKKREEIARVGKEHRDVWDAVDKQGSQGRPLPSGATERAIERAREIDKKLNALTAELNMAEATRAALHAGVGRLLATADPAARAPKILSLASAAAQASSFEDKLLFIRIFGAIRAPESRDALIELARLNPDGQVRTAAVSALGDLEDPTAIPTLAEALKDEVWSVKTAAATAMTFVPTVDGIPALAEALGKNEGGTVDAIVRALEAITGITYFDNGALWAEWFTREGPAIKEALGDLESGEPSIRIQALKTLAEKGTLAGVRAMLRHEGLDPARDTRARFKLSGIAAPETRPANKDEVEARRAAIATAFASRPKQVRERAIATLLLEPAARAQQTGDDQLEMAYIRAASNVANPEVLKMLKERADRTPSGKDAAEEENVRRAAVEALGWQNQDDAVVVAAAVLRDDKASREVKLAAVGALERLRREACVPPLIDLLLEKGALADAAHASLKSLTGADHGPDRATWHGWWSDTGKATAKLTRRKSSEEVEQEEKKETEAGAGRGTTFYGITTRSKRILYVLDISGSMNEDETPGATNKAGGTKIARAKRELKASVTALPEDALFNIIVFADGVQVWKPKLMTATKEVKAEANKWVDALNAIGATNIFDALEKAFDIVGRGATDKRYNLAVDTILFMSDGVANRGRIFNPRAIVAEVSRMNEHKKVCIHTIGVGKGHDAELMKRIARLNGGMYVEK